MFNKACLCFCIVGVLALLPQVWAEETTGDAPSLTDQKAPDVEAKPAETVDTQGLECALKEKLEEPEQLNMTGCEASINCVHGGTVSCESPVNNSCESSGQRCGRVTCGGETTWCPGVCLHAFNCATFCFQNYGSSDGDCDSFGCCVCF